MPKDRVLFVDTDGARSLIAAAILREHASERFEAWCAAVELRPVDSRVLDVLRQHGASTKRLFVLPLEDVVEEFRYIIVLANDLHILVSSAAKSLVWSLPDPVAANTVEDFEEARDQLEGLIFDWLNKFEERFEPEQAVPPHHLADSPVNVQRPA